MRKRPNIVFIMADQLAPQVLPAYRAIGADTPNIDRLAARGIVFDNAYCNFPLCAPARFSMLTGRLATRIGTYDNAAEMPATTPTFVHDLRLGGYRTCLAGKMHFVGPDQLHGYEERVTTDVYPSHFLWTPDWSDPETHWREWYHSMRAVLDSGPHRRSVNIAYDDEVTFEASRWLHEHADSGDERPFFLTVSYISPHDPYLAPPQYWAAFENAAVDDPMVADIPVDERDPHSRRLYYATGRHLETLDMEDVRRMRRAYLAVVAYLDAQIGRVLGALEATGRAGDTIVVFTSDHGDMLGERGMFFKMSFHEWSLRVPLIIAAGDAFAPGRVARNVSHLDLYPSLMELALGDDAPRPVAPLDGASVVGLMRGDDDAWSDVVLAEYTAEAASGPLTMVKQGDCKYYAGLHDEPLLYDIASDPGELFDLMHHPGYAGEREALMRIAAGTWDLESLDARVRESQRMRAHVSAALGTGASPSWDYQPFRDASTTYFRDLDAVQDSYRTDEDGPSRD